MNYWNGKVKEVILGLDWLSISLPAFSTIISSDFFPVLLYLPSEQQDSSLTTRAAGI